MTLIETEVALFGCQCMNGTFKHRQFQLLNHSYNYSERPKFESELRQRFGRVQLRQWLFEQPRRQMHRIIRSPK